LVAVRRTTAFLAATTLLAAGCGASRPTTFAARTAYTAHIVSNCRTYVDQQILVADTQSRGAGIAVQRVDSTLARCDATQNLARIESSGYERPASAARSALRAYEAWAYAALAYYRGQAGPEHVNELQRAADASAERALALINSARHRVGLAPIDDR
jgi:hypothetical protein